MSIDNNFSAPKSRSLPTPTNGQDLPNTLAAWKSHLGPLIKNSHPPAPPVNFRVTNARGGLQLSWSPVQGADGYEILKSLNGSFTDDLIVLPLSGASNTNHFDSLGGSAVTAHYRIRTTTGDPRRGPETGTVSHTSLDANDTSSSVTTFSDQFTTDRTRAGARLGNYGAIKSSSLGLATGGSGSLASAGSTGSVSPPSGGGTTGVSTLPFSAVTSGENLSSDMVVGQDASIRPDPTIPGVIDATDIQGIPVSVALPSNTNGLQYNSTNGDLEYKATPQTLATAAHKWLDSYTASTGAFTQTQPAYSDISGTPQLAQTKAPVASRWLNSYDSTTGLFTQTQPAYSDISGTPQLAVTKAAVGSKWLNSYDATTGLFTQTQPAYSDLSGTLPAQPTLTVTAATPTGSGTDVSLGNTTGFGNGAAATPVTTTALGTGSGPTASGVIVKYLKIDLGGTKYWIPLCQ